MDAFTCIHCRNSAKLICHCKIAPILFCFNCFKTHTSDQPQGLHLTSLIDSEFTSKRVPSSEICMCGSSYIENCMFCKHSQENKKRRIFDSKEYYQKDLKNISEQVFIQMAKNSLKLLKFKKEISIIADSIIKHTESWLASYLEKIDEIQAKVDQINKGVQDLKTNGVYDESNYIHWYIKDLLNSPETLQNISLDLFDYKLNFTGLESFISSICTLNLKQLTSASLCYFHPGSNSCTILNLTNNTQTSTQITTLKSFQRGASWCKVYDQKYFYCGGEEKNPSSQSILINPFESSHLVLPNMIFSRSYHSVVYYNQNIFVFGGHSVNGRLKNCEKYSFERGEWTELPKMLQARSHFTASLCKDKIFIAGGCGSSNVEMFCPLNLTFTKLAIDLPHQSYWTMTCSTSDQILIFQGDSIVRYSPGNGRSSVSTVVNDGGWWSEVTPNLYSEVFYFFRKQLVLSFNHESGELKEIYMLSK